MIDLDDVGSEEIQFSVEGKTYSFPSLTSMPVKEALAMQAKLKDLPIGERTAAWTEYFSKHLKKHCPKMPDITTKQFNKLFEAWQEGSGEGGELGN